MAWSSPVTYTAGQLITAADLNSALRDNLLYLYGDSGSVTLDNDYVVANLSTDGLVDGVDVSSHDAIDAVTAHGDIGLHTHTSSTEGGILSADAIISGRIAISVLPAGNSNFMWFGTGTADDPIYKH